MNPGRPLDAHDPDKLGVYRLTGVIGDGGMGRVYAGRSPAGRLVAVKVIRPDLASDEQFRQRFRSEVDRVRQVPAFATAEVLDADPDHEPPYLVFEYVDGPSLGEVVAADGPIGPADLRGLAIGLAVALRAIHSAGVVHRDLKPDNVLLARGSPKVIDFGIARPMSDPRPLTRAGDVVGSFAYLAPERFAGRGDAAADIFAWGAVLTYAGTGRIPFPADTDGAVALRIVRGEPELAGLADPLRGLITQALAKDPALRPTARELVDRLSTDRDELAAAESFHLGTTDATEDRPAVAATPVTAPAPQQAPTPPASFVGRTGELGEISAALGPDASVCVVGGPGGMGKTWLAQRWAHDAADRFPDGRLYVNLRGFDPSAEPLTPGVVLAGFLDALGVQAGAMPPDTGAQAGLFRTLMAGRRILVVLDNARDSAQVLPLLPGAPGSRVLITSRHRLAGVVTHAGARVVRLGLLPGAHAREMLAGLLGADRIAAEPDAVDDLLRHCAGLPLALAIVAARSVADPQFTLADLAGELAEERTRLDAFDAGEHTASLRAVFGTSYHALGDRAAEAFRLLGLAPGPEIGLAAAAALTGLEVDAARRALRELTGAHLLHEPAPGRFRMHDLVRLDAMDRALRHETRLARRAALRRLVDFHLHSAYPGDRLLYPHRPPLTLDAAVDGSNPAPPGDRGAALAWFETEQAGLLGVQRLAADEGWDKAAFELAWSMMIFNWRRGRLHENRAAWRLALTAATRLGDMSIEAQAHRYLGHALGQKGDLAEAGRELSLALAMSELLGDAFGQGHSHQLLAWLAEMRDDLPAALEHARNALRLSAGLDNPVWTGTALENLGWYRARLGNFVVAQAECTRALALHRAHGHTEGVTEALHSLGYIAVRTGRPATALEHYGAALRLARESGDTYLEAIVLEAIGRTYAESRQDGPARAALRDALMIYEAQHRAGRATRVRAFLAERFPGRPD